MNNFYAQLDINNICISISNLSGEVPEYNYVEKTAYNPITGTYGEPSQEFVSRMIPIPVYSESYIGLKYVDGTWTVVPKSE